MREFAIYEEYSYMPNLYNEKLTMFAMDNCYTEAEVEDYVEQLNKEYEEEFDEDNEDERKKVYVEWY